MADYLLSCDIGTSATKASLFSDTGKLIKSVVAPYKIHYSHNSWAEQEPEDWWAAVCETTKALIQSIPASSIAVISLSGQMSGATFVDSAGKPLRRSIIWLDNRSTKEVEELEKKVDRVRHFEQSGRTPNSVRPMEKVMWVKNNEPELYKAVYKVLQSKDYIAFKLTDNLVTDYTDASATYLLDRKKCIWHQELFETAGLSIDKFPELAASTQIIGYVTSGAAARTGLIKGIPVVIGAGDVSASTVGSKCVQHGQTHISIGSSAWASITLDKPFHDPDRVYSVLHPIPELYVNECCLLTAGISYSWLRDEICTYEKYTAQNQGKNAYDFMDEQVVKSTAGSNGVMFLPYLRGDMCLHDDPLATGAFIGLRAESTRADILRSVIEGVGFYLDLSLKLFASAVQDMNETILVGGAMKGYVWREILCDILGLRCSIPEYLEEATSLGAAIIGGVGIGMFKDFSVVDQLISIEQEMEPNVQNHAKYRKMEPVFDQAYSALKPLYEGLHAIK